MLIKNLFLLLNVTQSKKNQNKNKNKKKQKQATPTTSSCNYFWRPKIAHEYHKGRIRFFDLQTNDHFKEEYTIYRNPAVLI